MTGENDTFDQPSDGTGGFGDDAPTYMGESDASGAYAAIPRLEGPGAVLGNYKLLELLGEGGFGAVYSAEQSKPVRRRVALKIIKMGMDTRQVIARFEAERQALAMMDHPNIAKVLDAGATETGRPYFVMELVKGMPISYYCDQHNLSTNDRLKLFIDVCHAVQHAHQKGIIHRDLKPGNILVTLQDGVPTPKVIDFGIAKAMTTRLSDDTIYTEQRQLIGTPAYMSPEQAEMSGLDIDTRSDIYSLGVILYELLTSETPVDSATLRSVAYDQMSKMIREKTPPKPSTRVRQMADRGTEVAKKRGDNAAHLAKVLKGDLDWIIMKAIEKDRTRRYETANQFAMDIERHQRNEPVLAGPPSAAYRFSKFARRNRLPLAAAAAVFVALAGGLTAAVIGFSRAATERDRAVVARRQAEVARDESEAVTDFLADMLAAVDPGDAGRNVSVREVLDKASASIGVSFREQPLVEARLRDTMGQTYLALGEVDSASLHLPIAYEIRRRELGDENAESLASLGELARLQASEGKYDQAQATASAAVDRLESTLGPEDPRTLKARQGLATINLLRGDLPTAEAQLTSLLETRKRVLGDDDRDTLVTARSLARLYEQLGRWDESGAIVLSTLEAQRKSLGADHPETLRTKRDLAWLRFRQGNPGEAERQVREALDTMTTVLGDRHSSTLEAKAELAQILVGAGKYAEAAEVLEPNIESFREVLGDEHPETINALQALGVVRRRQGRPAESQQLLEEVLTLNERVVGADHPRTLSTMINLANAHLDQGRFPQAESLLTRALDGQRRVLGDGNIDTIASMITLANLYSRDGRVSQAEQMYRDALASGREPLGESHQSMLVASVNLALLYRNQEKYAEAEPLYRSAIDAMERSLGPDHPSRLRTMFNLAALYSAMGRTDDAIAWHRDTLERRTRTLGEEHAETLASLDALISLYETANRYADAVPLMERRVESRRSVNNPGDEVMLNALMSLADAYTRTGQVEKARTPTSELIDTLLSMTRPADANPGLLAITAQLLLTCEPEDLRRPDAAVGLAQRAVTATNGSSPDLLNILAQAQHAAGDTPAAVETLLQARKLVATDPAAANAIDEQIASYEAEANTANENARSADGDPGEN